MIIVLILSIVLTQVLFIALSWLTSLKVFHACTHLEKSHKKTHRWIRALSSLFSPLMPTIILANHIYFKEQEYSFKRDLQSHGSLEYDMGNDAVAEAKLIQDERTRDKDSDSFKVSKFRQIEKMRYDF